MVAGFLWVREQGCLLVPLVYSVSSSIPPSLSMCVCVCVCAWCGVMWLTHTLFWASATRACAVYHHSILIEEVAWQNTIGASCMGCDDAGGEFFFPWYSA